MMAKKRVVGLGPRRTWRHIPMSTPIPAQTSSLDLLRPTKKRDKGRDKDRPTERAKAKDELKDSVPIRLVPHPGRDQQFLLSTSLNLLGPILSRVRKPPQIP